MTIKNKIIDFANKHSKFQTRDLVVHFGDKYSRQYISRILNELIDAHDAAAHYHHEAVFLAVEAETERAFGHAGARGDILQPRSHFPQTSPGRRFISTPTRPPEG